MISLDVNLVYSKMKHKLRFDMLGTATTNRRSFAVEPEGLVLLTLPTFQTDFQSCDLNWLPICSGSVKAIQTFGKQRACQNYS